MIYYIEYQFVRNVNKTLFSPSRIVMVFPNILIGTFDRCRKQILRCGDLLGLSIIKTKYIGAIKKK